jgi:plastocyanin
MALTQLESYMVNSSGTSFAFANISATGNATITGNVSGTYFNGNGSALTGIVATVAQTVTTAAQPNISSVGTLTSLAVTGNVTAGNVLTNNLLYANGVAWNLGSAYTLPTASTTTLGGIKIDGSTLAFNGSGQLYYTGAGAGGYTLPTATTGVLGGVKVDGTTITINGSGVISSTGTVSSVSGTGTVNGLTLTGTVTSSGSLTLGGTLALTSTQVTTALTYTPYNSTNPSGYITTGSLSVTSASASGIGSLSYLNGVFTFTPAASYSLPTATSSVLGGVKVGTGLSIDGSGVLSAAASSIPTYPAITQLDVTNSGASAYLFNNQYSGNNPTIYAISGTTIAFNLNVTGHPFLIRQTGVNFNTGLIHVSTTGTVSTGTSAQGQVTGILYWQIPQASAGAFAYQCSIHGGIMVGVITVKQISSLP